MLLGTPPAAAGLSIRVVESISAIPPEDWDALVPGQAINSHGWLRTMETALLQPVPHLYFIAYAAGGSSAGALPVRLEATASADRNLDLLLAGRWGPLLSRLPFSSLPALVCGAAGDPGMGILIRPTLPPSRQFEIKEALAASVDSYARSRNYSVCFRRLTPADSDLAAFLVQRGYLSAPELPVWVLPLPFASFQDYRRWLKEHHRATEKNIPTERNRARREGLQIRELIDPSPWEDHLHRLLHQHHWRRNGHPLPFHSRFLTQLKANLGSRARIFTAWLDEKPVGVVLRLAQGAQASFAWIGIDPSSNRRAAVYLNLLFHFGIQSSLADGFTRICFGRALGEMKARRGCQPVASRFFLRGRPGWHHTCLRALLAIYTRAISGKS